MNPSERLVESSHNRLARALLRSAELDEAPDNTVAKVAFALGLGSTALVTTVTTNAAATAVVGSAAGATTVAAVPTAGIVTAAGMLKVMAIVSLTCGTLSYGSVKLALKFAEKPAVTTVAARPAVPTPTLRQTPATRSAPAVEPVANFPAPPPPPVDSDLVTAARGQGPRQSSATEATSPRETNAPVLGRQAINSNKAEPASPKAAALPKAAAERVADIAPPPPIAPAATLPGEAAGPVASAAGRSDLPKPAGDLEREVAQLDHARAALGAGQPAQALRELNAYRAQTPHGTLAAESIVLRVKALLALGQRTAAEREANPLLMAAPQSRHAERLRQLLGAP